MGLDMFLGRMRKELLEPSPAIVSAYEHLKRVDLENCKDRDIIEQFIKNIEERYPFLKDIDLSELSTEEVAYWRKANAIHRWFVEVIQNGNDDCGEYVVPKEKLEELLELCKKVRNNPELAPKLLPTLEGFFFGSTEYDDYYFKQIDYTIEVLDRILKETDFDKYVILYSSWW